MSRWCDEKLQSKAIAMSLPIKDADLVVALRQRHESHRTVGCVFAVAVDDLLLVDVEVRAVVRNQPERVFASAADIELAGVVHGKPFDAIGDPGKPLGEVSLWH